MAVIVQKYGGSSVANPERIKAVARRVIEAKKAGYDTVVVVSAIGGTTDELIKLARQITDSPSEREVDVLISTGEQVSVALLAMAVHSLGYEAISFTGLQIGIVTDSAHTRARIVKVEPGRIKSELSLGKIVIVAGFQGITQDSEITTLGRGASDLTAIALGTVLKAEVVEIYTDVDGVYTADPKVAKDARKLPVISYDEMLEMASLGAQVMQSRAVEFAKRFNVPIHVRSSFSKDAGTLIREEAKSMEKTVVRGVAENKGEAKVSLLGVPDRPGIAALIFKRLADDDINIDMIVQNVSEVGRSDISFTIEGSDLKRTVTVAEKVAKDIGAKEVSSDENIAKVSVVGLGMRSHSGIAAKMFSALAGENINIEMISTSEIKISCIIRKKMADKAVEALHTKFGLGKQRKARRKRKK
jgi:aspartate kinase